MERWWATRHASDAIGRRVSARAKTRLPHTVGRSPLIRLPGKTRRASWSHPYCYPCFQTTARLVGRHYLVQHFHYEHKLSERTIYCGSNESWRPAAFLLRFPREKQPLYSFNTYLQSCFTDFQVYLIKHRFLDDCQVSIIKQRFLDDFQVYLIKHWFLDS